MAAAWHPNRAAHWLAGEAAHRARLLENSYLVADTGGNRVVEQCADGGVPGHAAGVAHGLRKCAACGLWAWTGGPVGELGGPRGRAPADRPERTGGTSRAAPQPLRPDRCPTCERGSKGTALAPGRRRRQQPTRTSRPGVRVDPIGEAQEALGESLVRKAPRAHVARLAKAEARMEVAQKSQVASGIDTRGHGAQIGPEPKLERLRTDALSLSLSLWANFFRIVQQRPSWSQAWTIFC